MIFEGFKIAAIPFITDAYCKCSETLKQVSNGLVGAALYCQKCENVYLIKKIKVPAKKVTKDFLKQCRQETKSKTHE